VTEKTHYRKAFNSPYLSSADIVEPTRLTVKFVKLEMDKTKKTKDLFNTAYFTQTEIRPGEPLKPMILNAFNSKVLKAMTDSPFIDDWNNIEVTIYVDHNVRFGRDTVEGLRIDPNPPKAKPFLKAGTAQWANAVAAYKRDGNFDRIMSRVQVTEDQMTQIKVDADAIS